MSSGVLGGTFNPIHLGHLRAAEEVRGLVSLDRIVFVPSFIPPHKALHADVSGETRLRLVRQAIRDNPFFEANPFEVERKGKSYSIHTMEYFTMIYHEAPFFILGQDAFNDISQWFDFPRVLWVSNFVVMSRPGAQRPDLEGVLGEFAAGFYKTDRGFINSQGREIIPVEITSIDISSTRIRQLRAKGMSVKYLVPPGVEACMDKERMYIS
ncbi:MAG: nicotinate-nucleotide adenylyltransferase [Thermodesulfobacteriota bacterium]|nr:nicotinate-nucleotide adenylyltransferase [Thermodesulfobacteriota bacterium]